MNKIKAGDKVHLEVEALGETKDGFLAVSLNGRTVYISKRRIVKVIKKPWEPKAGDKVRYLGDLSLVTRDLLWTDGEFYLLLALSYPAVPTLMTKAEFFKWHGPLED